MKDFLITIYNGGDEAVAAVQRMGDDWRVQLEQAAKEVEDARLTDAEREVIQWAANAMRPECRATLRGLLERTRATGSV